MEESSSEDGHDSVRSRPLPPPPSACHGDHRKPVRPFPATLNLSYGCQTWLQGPHNHQIPECLFSWLRNSERQGCAQEMDRVMHALRGVEGPSLGKVQAMMPWLVPGAASEADGGALSPCHSKPIQFPFQHKPRMLVSSAITWL